MKLLEFEGKALLSKHGVKIARGAVWPQVPESQSGWVVKAQVLAGGRGKNGGILFASDLNSIKQHAEALTGSKLANEPVHSVYIEEKLTIEGEYYLAAMVNRDEGRVNLIASSSGGVEIENVPKSQIVKVVIDPLIGLAAFQIQQITRELKLEGDLGNQFGIVVAQVLATLILEDAELVEINPVILTKDREFIAADSKVVLDDDAVSRHKTRSEPIAWVSDSKFMQRCRELDVIGVDNRARLPVLKRPHVAILGNGAGLTMATYDQIFLSGVDVVGAIELHGALARGVEHTAKVICALFMLEPDIVFINAFYQLRSCDALAKALVLALEESGAVNREKIVTRMRGVNQQSCMEILEAANVFYSPSLRDATEKVLTLANSMVDDVEPIQ